jgi:hypothetical protein
MVDSVNDCCLVVDFLSGLSLTDTNMIPFRFHAYFPFMSDSHPHEDDVVWKSR